MKVTLQDGRQMVGQMLAFDKVSVARRFPLYSADQLCST
jgi:hypothetical protein